MNPRESRVFSALFPIIVAAICAAPQRSHAQTWSLNQEWSDETNPFDVWSIRDRNDNLLPGILRPNGGDSWGISQRSYGDAPGVFKSNGTEHFGHDWIAGDLIAIGGSALEPFSQPVVRWTSPIDGIVKVNGTVWWGGHPAQFFRANDWLVSLNSEVLTGGIGTVGSGSGRGRQNPIRFEEGFGGPDALNSLVVHTGDTIDLTIKTNAQSFGFYNAYSGFTFDIARVPAPSAAVVLGAFAWFGAARRHASANR